MEIVKLFAKSISQQVSSQTDGQTFEGGIGNILYAVYGVIGILAVVFIIIGGVNYSISQGDPGKTKKARDTILYAAIGLIVVLSAFAITAFILKGVSGQ